MIFPPLHPLYAVASIGVLSLLAAAIGRVVPFYRRELSLEKASRQTPLDGLRGILCFGVMYHHAAILHGQFVTGVWQPTAAKFYMLLGETSVAMFFCITAFLFWGQALDRKGEIAVWPFFRGRMFRVIPLYLVACAGVLYLLRSNLNWTDSGTWLVVGQMSLMGLRVWASLGAIDVNMINCGVIWTLRYEWAFYFALPALSLLARGRGGWRIVFVFLAAWVVAGIDVDLDYKAYFAIGVLAAHLSRMPRTAAVLRSFYLAPIIIGLLGIMPLYTPTGYGWIPLLFTAAAFIPIACGNSLLGALNFSGLRLMGIISYSVYLLHGLFLHVAQRRLQLAWSHGNQYYWLAVLGLACIVLCCCFVSFAIVEWPFMHLEKRLRKKPAGPSVVAMANSASQSQ